MPLEFQFLDVSCLRKGPRRSKGTLSCTALCFEEWSLDTLQNHRDNMIILFCGWYSYHGIISISSILFYCVMLCHFGWGADWNSIVPPSTSLIWPCKHHLLNLSEPPFPSGLSRLREAQVLNVHSTYRQPSTQAAGMDDLHWDMQWGSRPFGHSHLLLIRAQNKKPTRSQNKV